MEARSFPLQLDPTPAGETVPPGMPPVFDAHVHLMPDRLLGAIWSWFERYAWPIHSKPHAEEILPFLFRSGVAGCIALPYAHKPGIARELNRMVADCCSKDDRAFGFGTVFPGEEGCSDILAEAFALGLHGVKLHPHVQGFGANASEVQAVCEICRLHDRPIILHAGREPKTTAFAYPVDPHAVCSAESVASLMDNHPGLRLCVPHLGADEYEAYRALIERFDTLWVDTAMAISGFLPCRRPPPLGSYRQDRILYGSDFPNLPYPWDKELKMLLQAGLSEERLWRIVSGNVQEFLNLPGADTHGH